MHDRLTQSDIDKMKAEISRRKSVDRVRISADIKSAREQGDLSENFEYYAAKKARGANESRIRYLENMVKTAVVIDDAESDDPGKVELNRPVDIYFPDDGTTETYRLVTTIRCDSLRNLISIDSPLGKAINGKHEGDKAQVTLENGAGYSIEIKKVYPTVDDAEDEIQKF